MDLNNFIEKVQPFSMTSVERITELYNSLEYIRTNNIDGDIVECGVWKGGNIIGIIEYLKYHNILDKSVWLYDTFEGMTSPEEIDVDLDNKKASDILNSVLCYSSLTEVKQNLSKSEFNNERLKFIVGDVSETLLIESNKPNKISLLRLDTDWYKSTKDELIHLYPILVNDGVLIVDDYGHWKGSKTATDEFFEENNISLEIIKIDYTGIKIIKK
jgi:O-methyltransferase